MKCLPTSVEIARTLLAIFKREKMRAGDTTMIYSILLEAQRAGLARDGVTRRLRVAELLGWVVIDKGLYITLTDQGYSAM